MRSYMNFAGQLDPPLGFDLNVGLFLKIYIDVMR